MKYIITESALEKTIAKYLDIFLEGKEIEHIPASEDDDDEDWGNRRMNANPLIQIYTKYSPVDFDEDKEEVMWYEFNTELMWVHESIFNEVREMFLLSEVRAEKQIGKWFGNKFGVRVRRVQHSS